MSWLNNLTNMARDAGKQLGTINPFWSAQLTGGANAIDPSGAQSPTNYGFQTSSGQLNQDIAAGNAVGQAEFYDDPDMKMLRQRREDLSKGFSGEELGALRSQALNEIEGQRGAYMRNLQSNLAKGGSGGARSAAIKSQADRGFQQNRAETERKFAIDNAGLKRQGVGDLQDFIFRQKTGKLGTGIAYGQLGASERGTQNALDIANKESKKGILGNLLGDLF